MWKECNDCSRCTDFAKGPSRLGVHKGGNFTGLGGSKRSLYLWEVRVKVKVVKVFCVTVLVYSFQGGIRWNWIFLYKLSSFTCWCNCSFESESLRGSHHYYFPPWQLASPWWTLSNGLFCIVCMDPRFHCPFLTFPWAPPWCPCTGTWRRWLWISYHWGSSCCWTSPALGRQKDTERHNEHSLLYKWTHQVWIQITNKAYVICPFKHFATVQMCSQFSRPAWGNLFLKTVVCQKHVGTAMWTVSLSFFPFQYLLVM